LGHFLFRFPDLGLEILDERKLVLQELVEPVANLNQLARGKFLEFGFNLLDPAHAFSVAGDSVRINGKAPSAVIMRVIDGRSDSGNTLGSAISLTVARNAETGQDDGWKIKTALTPLTARPASGL
jgi:hypothetical protein